MAYVTSKEKCIISFYASIPSWQILLVIELSNPYFTNLQFDERHTHRMTHVHVK